MLVMVATGSPRPAGRRHGAEAARTADGRRDEGADPLQMEGDGRLARADGAALPGPAAEEDNGAQQPLRAALPPDLDESGVEAHMDDEAGCPVHELLEEQSWDSAWGDDPVTASAIAELVDQSEGYTDSGRYCNSACPRCGHPEESTCHQLWECEANQDIPGVRLDFLPEVREEHGESPCFFGSEGPPLGLDLPLVHPPCKHHP